MKDAFYVQLARVPFAIMQCDIIIAWVSFSLPISFGVWENEEIMALVLLVRKP